MYLKKLLAVSIALVGLAACGDGQNSTSTTSTSAPTTTASSSPAATTTSTSSTKAAVKIDEFTNYTYKSGIFSIDIPKSWSSTDNTKAGEVIVTWADPNKNAGLVVDIFQAPEGFTPEKSTELLQTFLKQTFGSKSDFKMSEPEKQSDGSARIIWGYTDEGTKVPLQGSSFIEKHTDKISLITVIFPAQQVDELKEPINKILNSFKVTPTVKIE